MVIGWCLFALAPLARTVPLEDYTVRVSLLLEAD